MSTHKWSFCPISALCSKNNPRNIKYMPVVIFFACLDLERKSSLINRLIYMLKEFSLPKVSFSKEKERGYSGGSVPDFHRFPYYAQRATIMLCYKFLSLSKAIMNHCQEIYSREFLEMVMSPLSVDMKKLLKILPR